MSLGENFLNIVGELIEFPGQSGNSIGKFDYKSSTKTTAEFLSPALISSELRLTKTLNLKHSRMQLVELILILGQLSTSFDAPIQLELHKLLSFQRLFVIKLSKAEQEIIYGFN